MALQRPLFPCHSPAELLRQIADALRPGPSPTAGPDSRSPSSVAAPRSGASRSPQGSGPDTVATRSPVSASKDSGRDEVRSWLEDATPLHLELAKVRDRIYTYLLKHTSMAMWTQP